LPPVLAHQAGVECAPVLGAREQALRRFKKAARIMPSRPRPLLQLTIRRDVLPNA
jgi:hypothetical protein